MKKFLILFILFSLSLSASVVHISQLPENMQKTVVPDMEGNVLINDLDESMMQYASLSRELPSVMTGWPVSYTGSNCKNGAIYMNMDADPEDEILFGVGTKVTALNLDGTTVTGWPVQLSYYIWSSPACGDIDGDGEIEIVCTSRNNTSGNEGALYAFELDGTPCTGFPVAQAGGGTNNASLFDLNGDGDMEILVNVRNHPQGWVYVFEGDGTVYPGFPQELDYIPGAGISAGDVTGDGTPEIIALSYNKLHVYDLSGNLLPGFPLENTGYNYSYSQPILYDLDGDNVNEIIWGGCAADTGAVFAVNGDASAVAGWPQSTDYWIFGTVSLGDIDQDGNIDVVIGDQVSSGTPTNHIYAWDASGNAIAGFPAGPTNAIYAQVGIADLDGDNNVELMIDDNNFGYGYDAYNHDGTHCMDWPLPCGTVWSSTTMQITPAFGDVNNDGNIEIIGAATDIVGWVVECYTWETGEVWNEDLAYMIIDGVNVQHNGLYSPATTPPPTFAPPENVVVDDLTGIMTWQPPATIIDEDNFDSYTPGDFLAVVAPDLWTTWTNSPGGSEDVVVTDAQANSPSNSILVEENNDLVFIMEDYYAGVYSMDLDMYVPSGYSGYVNLQKTTTPGEEWGFQAYFMTDGNASIDAGAEAAAVFPYSHDEWMDLRIVVDLDNDWADFYVDGELEIGWQWTLGTFGTPGLLQLGGMNIWGGANSATTDTPMFYVDNVEFKEIVPATDPVYSSFNVYLDGVFVGNTTDLVWAFDGLIPTQSYTGGVSAVYTDPAGESVIVEDDFTYDPVTTFDPPNNVNAEVQDFNEVLITWELPGAATEYIQHHSGYDNNGIGTGAAADFICAARFDDVELGNYYGDYEINGVNIFLHSMDFSYVGIQVYEGGSYGAPGTLVYEEDITSSAVAGDWTNHMLTTPVPLVAGNEYWLAYDISATGDHPAAVDMGPMVPDKGAWMYFSGAWDLLPNLGAGLDFNWVITGALTENTDSMGNNTALIGRQHTISNSAEFEAEYTPSYRRPNSQIVNYDSRALSGYKVYRDGAEIAEITNAATLEYLDGNGLDVGDYEYYVTAVYSDPAGESDPSNLENVTITLPAPVNPTATSNWPNILLQWSAPSQSRAIESYNIYRNDEFLNNTTSTFYLDANVPAGYNNYNVACVFTGGYEGEWSDDFGSGPVPGTDPNLVPITTSLDGNYPNPFNPTTKISFGLHKDQNVEISVYNIKGEKVKTLINSELEAGYHDVIWNGKDDDNKSCSSGVYFYKMKADDFIRTRKMILLK
ncbi:MAG: T9SS type A sorting domain-containing protein [Candidatus Cloacimonetes bacterium]|nr:T9SS type A sorting domain-containing protein [Candidatus Cloacimonadota bacterium]